MEHSPALPARPHLRPGTEIVPIDHERVLLRSFSGTVMLSGEFVSSELPVLLRLLDGTATIQDITEKVSENFRPEFEKFLFIMMEKGLLHDGDQGGTDSGHGGPFGANSHEKAYWSLYGPTTGDAFSRLQSSTVVVANLGGVGLSITRALAVSGVGKIVAIDPHRVRSIDEMLGYEAEDIGKPRVDAVAAYIANRKCRNFVPIAANVHGLSNFEELVSEADLVVLCSDNMSLAGYDITNEACIRYKTRWVSARIDRSRGVIGPFVVPEQTACFVCFELRSRANSEYPTDHEAIYRHWKELDSIPDNWPTIQPFVNVVGNYLALDIQRVLAGNHLSAIFGRILYLDLHTFESRFHEILKLPRCPACSRGRERPRTRIWDIRSTADPQVPT